MSVRSLRLSPELVPWHRGCWPGAPLGTGPAAEYKPTLPDVTWESRRCIEGVWGTSPAAGGSTLKLAWFSVAPPRPAGDSFFMSAGLLAFLHSSPARFDSEGTALSSFLQRWRIVCRAVASRGAPSVGARCGCGPQASQARFLGRGPPDVCTL